MSNTTPPLHIVHGVLTLDVGGLERIVTDLARTGVTRGHRVSVICVEQPGQLAAEVEATGANVISLGKPPGRLRAFEKLAADTLARIKPDVIHTHAVGAAWYLGSGAKALGVPILHTEHIDNVQKASGLLAKFKTRLHWFYTGRTVGLFCGVSDDITKSARRWGNVPAAKLETVLNGIDTDRYLCREFRDEVRESLGIPKGAVVIGTVGRLNEVKRQDLLLQSVAAMRHDGIDLRVLLVGDGPEREPLTRLAERLGIQARVHFAGYQSAPERFLAAMDLFALTSRMEGLPLAMLEAWASGLPVVSSAVGGIPAVVIDGKNGLLFPSGGESALTASLSKLLTDHDLAERVAIAGQSTVRENYSLTRMAENYEQRYRRLIGGTSRDSSPA